LDSVTKGSYSIASAKEITAEDSEFSRGFSNFAKMRIVNDKPKTWLVFRNHDSPQTDRIEYRNKGTRINYRQRIFGSVDSNGKLHKSHKLNFGHFVRIDTTHWQVRQKKFYELVKFWNIANSNLVVGSFSRISDKQLFA
jgi:hypothetical protein